MDRALWDRYKAWLLDDEECGFRLDLSRMFLPDDIVETMAVPFGRAFDAMEQLEQGSIANPTEGRKVGHYWLRAPERAPAEDQFIVTDTLDHVLKFADDVHARGDFKNLIVVGIGGSALGPQFVTEALAEPVPRMTTYFLDNTDPDGFDRTMKKIGAGLPETLAIVTSKGGTTPETRNMMVELRAAYEHQGLDFGAHAVAVTVPDSAFDKVATDLKFLWRFPMADWVGGRTSEFSAVGLLPAALQGIDVREMLAGAAMMDHRTRTRDVRKNPAALLALAWHHAGRGHGEKDMVIIPYKDRLSLLARYLQQLVMESLGKATDLDGRVVNQGIAVYGNKGSTDQHSYVQQLRDGLPNFFVTFVDVLKDRDGDSIEVDNNSTSGDFLMACLLGTRRALYENKRPSLTMTLREVNPRSVGMLIALYERAVGLYASLVNINAYDQPGVQAGKLAAADVLTLKNHVVTALKRRGRGGGTCEDLAAEVGSEADVETVFHILEHLVARSTRHVEAIPGATPFETVYRYTSG